MTNGKFADSNLSLVVFHLSFLVPRRSKRLPAMDKVRVGVVGVGALGYHHARVYAALPQAKLVGVADKVPGRAEQIALPLETVGYTDYRQLFGKVDAVSIATPTTLHGDR
ncbi:MAG: hypothetical protein DMG08_22340 [Acidobacteria bacterium]|nr:MAG: hypothetical protein DMG08_22340 [Acidobacteriota bacterium]